MSTDCEDFILARKQSDDEAAKVVQRSKAKIESGQLSLLEFVSSLQGHVNGGDDYARAASIKYLADVTKVLDGKIHSRQHIAVLCDFFCELPSSIEVVNGLQVLVDSGKLIPEKAALTFRTLIHNYKDLQNLPQVDRFQVLLLLNSLIEKCRKDLKSDGSDTLRDTLDLVRGEKDPRNLMIVFSVLFVMIAEWNLKGLEEEVFEAVFCYFPITFRPPPNDPYGITSQDLKARLKNCLSASSALAPFTIPRLIDKLDTGSMNAKKDVLEALQSCAENYDPLTLSNFSTQIWDAIKYEVFNAQNEELADLAKSVLKALAKRLRDAGDQASSDQETPLVRFLRFISTECEEKLREPQHKQAQPSAQIARAIAESSVEAQSLVLARVLPLLTSLYQDSEQFEKRRAILELLLPIVSSAIVVGELKEPGSPCAALLESKDSLLQIFTQALLMAPKKETEFRIVGLECLSICCRTPDFLRPAETESIVKQLDDVVTSDQVEDPKLRSSAIQELEKLSQVQPRSIIDISVPAFLSALPDHATELGSCISVLKGLAKVSGGDGISDTVIRRLLSKLNAIVSAGNATPEYLQAIIATIHHIQSESKGLGTPETYRLKVTELLKQAAGNAVAGSVSSLNDVRVLEAIGGLACLLTRLSGAAAQEEARQNSYLLYQPGPILTGSAAVEALSEPCRATIVLSTWLLAALPRTASPFESDDESTRNLEILIQLCLTESDPAVRQKMLQHLALLVNKFFSPQSLDWCRERLCSESDGLLSAKSSTRQIQAGLWVAKGMILRLSNLDAISQKLHNLVAQEEHGIAAARGCRAMLSPDPVLSKEYDCLVRPLWQQRIFQLQSSKLIEMYKGGSPKVQKNCLIALCGLIEYIPMETIQSQAADLMPYMIQSLLVKDQHVQQVSISKIEGFAAENSAEVESHVSSLVTNLMKIARERDSQESSRSESLRCLKNLPARLNKTKLLPYRTPVLRALAEVLDDPKRSVRKQAVDCRASWVNLEDGD